MEWIKSRIFIKSLPLFSIRMDPPGMTGAVIA